MPPCFQINKGKLCAIGDQDLTIANERIRSRLARKRQFLNLSGSGGVKE